MSAQAAVPDRPDGQSGCVSPTSPSDTVLCTPPTPSSPDQPSAAEGLKTAAEAQADRPMPDATVAGQQDEADGTVKSDGGMASSSPVYKGKKAARLGWDALPPAILSRIMGEAALDSVPQGRLAIYMGMSKEYIVRALVAARCLSSFRRVSTRWRETVDSHPFWDRHFIPVLDPTRSYRRIQAAKADDAPFSSSRSAVRFSDFQLAKRNTAHVCLICRLNLPNPRGGQFYLADPDVEETHPQIGRVPTCESHTSHCCDNCLIADAKFDPTGRTPSLDLAEVHPRWKNELGQAFGHTKLVCIDCRLAMLRAAIREELRTCARGSGPVCGLSIAAASEDIITDLSDDCCRWLFNGAGSAPEAAEDLLETIWPAEQLGEEYVRINQIALGLQMEEAEIRRTYIITNKEETEDQRWRRIELLKKMHPPGYEYDAEADADRMFGLYQHWLGMRQSVRNARQAYDLLADIEEKEHAAGPMGHWISERKEAAVGWWVRQRIMAGIWVLPSKEADLFATLGEKVPVLPLVSDIVSGIRQAKAAKIASSTAASPPTVPPVGAINFHPRPEHKFLPSPTFATDILDDAFVATLRMMLRPAMVNLVNALLTACDDDHVLTERACAKQDFEELMSALATPALWRKSFRVRRRASGPLPATSTVGDLGDKDTATPTDRAEEMESAAFDGADDDAPKQAPGAGDALPSTYMVQHLGDSETPTATDETDEVEIATVDGEDDIAPKPDLSSSELLRRSQKRKSPTEGAFSPRKVVKVEDAGRNAQPDTLADLLEVPPTSSFAAGSEEDGSSSVSDAEMIEDVRHIQPEQDERVIKPDTRSNSNRSSPDPMEEVVESDEDTEDEDDNDPWPHGPPDVPILSDKVTPADLASEAIMSVWDHVREQMLRQCACGICRRAQNIAELMEAQRVHDESKRDLQESVLARLLSLAGQR